MRKAVISTLKGLYEGKRVTALNSAEFLSTRITNEILILRQKFGISIIMDRNTTENGKWYGSYRLERTPKNLKKVREYLERYSPDYESNKSKH